MNKSKILLLLPLMTYLLGCTGGGDFKNLSIVTLQEKDIFNFESQLEENDIFIKNSFGFDHDDSHFYYLDNHFCSIFKYRQDSFKLVKMISSRGQGPGEISEGIGLSYKKGKLYIVDSGYGGIKIFDTQGKFLKQFKVKGLSIGIATNKLIIDVNENEEIYVRTSVTSNGSLITVYDINGKRLRGLIPVNVPKNEDYWTTLLKHQLIFTIDNFDNVIVLFVKHGKLEKYDKKGVRLWSREILQALPEKERNEEGVKRTKSGSIRYALNFLGLSILEDNRIFAIGVYTGILLSEEGKVIGLFKLPGKKRVIADMSFWRGSRLITLKKQYDFKRYIDIRTKQ